MEGSMSVDHKHVRVGVTAFVINPATGDILLNKRACAHGNGSWSLCGGHMEKGETPIQGVIREYMEEAGLDIAEEDVTPLGFVNDYFTESDKHYVTLFHVTLLPEGQTPQVMEPDIVTELSWASLQNMPQPLFQPLATFLREHGDVVAQYIEQVKRKHAA
jgi:8-oxo-dGTP diphosphatase